MTNKPGSTSKRASTGPRTSTSANPRVRVKGPSAKPVAGGAASGAAGPRESWRSRTGQGVGSTKRFRRGDSRRVEKPRPRRIPGTLARPTIEEAKLTLDFEQFLATLDAAGLQFKETERLGLWTYGRFLVERAGTLNLISQVDRPRFFTRHLLECLVPGLVSHARGSRELVDIGSGGGLPGLPLALVCPRLRATLVEPRQRKVQFLEAAILECGLSDRVTVFQGTADRFAEQLPGAPTTDLVTARAVDRLEKVWGWARRILVPGGWLATYKGPAEIEEELQKLADGVPSALEAFPCLGQPRAVLVIQNPHT